MINLGRDFVISKKKREKKWVLSLHQLRTAALKECSLLVLCPGNPSLVFTCLVMVVGREGKGGSPPSL